MAIILSDKYPGRSNPPSLDYPQGSIKDQSAPQAKDGTPLKADWANDHEGFFQSLLKEAGITANGNVDTVVASQYFDALKSVIETESPTPSQATETTSGVAKVATQTIANGLSNNEDFITPAKLVGATKSVLSASGNAPVFAIRAWVNFDGSTNPPTIRKSGNISSITDNGVGDYTLNFIVPMPHAEYALLGTHNGADQNLNPTPSELTVNSVRFFTNAGVGSGSGVSFGRKDPSIVSIGIAC